MGAAYTVTSQTPTTYFDSTTQKPIQGVIIAVVTPGGDSFTLNVPESGYNAANVKTLIEARLVQYNAVAALGSGS